MSALKLCVLSSEILPYAKTGGLADVLGALPPPGDELPKGASVAAPTITVACMRVWMVHM